MFSRILPFPSEPRESDLNRWILKLFNCAIILQLVLRLRLYYGHPCNCLLPSYLLLLKPFSPIHYHGHTFFLSEVYRSNKRQARWAQRMLQAGWYQSDRGQKGDLAISVLCNKVGLLQSFTVFKGPFNSF